MKSRLTPIARLAAALAFLASPCVGLADSIQLSDAGTFENTSATLGYDGIGTNEFKWGAVIPDLRSSLTWTNGSPPITADLSPGATFTLGSLTFANNRNGGDGLADTTHVDLHLALTLLNPSGNTSSENFKLSLVSTFIGPDDTSFVSLGSSPLTLVADNGAEYQVTLLGFDTTGVPDAPSSGSIWDGTYVSNDSWIDSSGTLYVREGKSSGDLGVLASVVMTRGAVPEPASVVSAAVACLSGLAFAVRRRRNAARG